MEKRLRVSIWRLKITGKFSTTSEDRVTSDSLPPSPATPLRRKSFPRLRPASWSSLSQLIRVAAAARGVAVLSVMRSYIFLRGAAARRGGVWKFFTHRRVGPMGPTPTKAFGKAKIVCLQNVRFFMVKINEYRSKNPLGCVIQYTQKHVGSQRVKYI